MAIEYSVVVPTYKECGNLKMLCDSVFSALEKKSFPLQKVEMVFVDDNSRDGSVEVVEELRKDGKNVRIIVRTKERGLSSAVIHGIEMAKGNKVVVMDADLQHPPESVSELFNALNSDKIEFVCGTRYGHGAGIDKNWPIHRRLISWGARLLARPLTPLSDPMSGFFGLRKSVFQRSRSSVNSIGYKIALEIFVKCNVQKFSEVTFSFGTRSVGESKLTGKVMISYLHHLYTLYKFKFGIFFYFCVLLVFWLALASALYLLYTMIW